MKPAFYLKESPAISFCQNPPLNRLKDQKSIVQKPSERQDLDPIDTVAAPKVGNPEKCRGDV